MKAPAHVVIVGASLAGLRTAEALRDEGYAGRLTLIGDEPHAPYDRPPLSKQVLSGWVRADETALPRLRPVDADWRLGCTATGLDLQRRRVKLADGGELGFDRLVIATGARARPWPIAGEAALSGVFSLRTRDDAAALVAALEDGPRRVLVIGAGFTGCEVASVCRQRGLEVTVVERAETPLHAALGPLIGGHAADLQRRAGVDLRCGTLVTALLGDGNGRVQGARLASGETIEAKVVVVCLGALRNTEWLDGAGLAAGAHGVACDDRCRVLGVGGAPRDDVFVCGDVARFPHPLAEGERIALEHWGGAVDQARIAAANIVRPGSGSLAATMPAFWSMQFGANFKSVGLPTAADQVLVVQGSAESGRFVAAYGRAGRLVGAVSVNQAQWLAFYEEQIAAGAAFPPTWRVVDAAADAVPAAAGFPARALAPSLEMESR